MSNLKMSLGLKIRSMVSWVQKNKNIDKTLFSMSSPAYIKSIKCAEVIRNVLKILAALNT